ncbi:hypothetical protein M406DRAFT_327438 [Cryphonectria parasitica EP155]|uniref:BZIP domain-containing protein n=1 Tax=Cryphonectria parasitica (strain ATCC 38755 / EP155) TaxID=660469 RepID=A0A9P4Y9L5_CRYP1|nr:uncharacterized protein M406DRAFT_327438 [Cryphonectria parasitica EP155]KAF3769031.1 hypothetical protein M406DRAFT_327438 [Cryphonectria parasitica EP155]
MMEAHRPTQEERPSFTTYWRKNQEDSSARTLRFVQSDPGQPSRPDGGQNKKRRIKKKEEKRKRKKEANINVGHMTIATTAAPRPPPPAAAAAAAVATNSFSPGRAEEEEGDGEGEGKQSARNKRRAQVRRAQIQHRQRKADYVKQLQSDIAGIREQIEDAEQARRSLRVENQNMRAYLSSPSSAAGSVYGSEGGRSRYDHHHHHQQQQQQHQQQQQQPHHHHRHNYRQQQQQQQQQAAAVSADLYASIPSTTLSSPYLPPNHVLAPEDDMLLQHHQQGLGGDLGLGGGGTAGFFTVSDADLDEMLNAQQGGGTGAGGSGGGRVYYDSGSPAYGTGSSRASPAVYHGSPQLVDGATGHGSDLSYPLLPDMLMGQEQGGHQQGMGYLFP